jgi:uncharacterized protein YbjT (DUF2867 family)
MNVVIYGATGMVGQGVLRECLLDPEITKVTTIGRTGTGQSHPKLTELVLPDLLDYSAVDLSNIDACFFCLGATAAGKSEAQYRAITYDLTMAAAHALSAANPNMTFVFVSGAGTDSTGTSRMMWARVKGETENALFAMPFHAYAFRPGFIQPMHGIHSRTPAYRIFYKLLAPIVPLFRRALPRYVTTTEQLGRAMIRVAKSGWVERVLETGDINRV